MRHRLYGNNYPWKALLAIKKDSIVIEYKELRLRVNDDEVIINVWKSTKQQMDFKISIINSVDEVVTNSLEVGLISE